MNSGIYKIINIKTGDFYIGSSKNIVKRWKIHKSKLKNKNHINNILQSAWNKYGENNLILEILETCDKDKLYEKEQFYLDNLNPKYNIGLKASGGDNLTNNPNKEKIIDKIRKTLKENYQKLTIDEKINYSEKFKGSKNPNYGNNWTDSMKKQMSDKVRKYFETHEHYKNGKKHEEIYGEEKAKEINDKLSKFASSRIGDKNAFFGKHHNDETKKKLKDYRMGKYFGEQNIPFTINNQQYNSLGEASNELEIPITTIRWRLRSKNKKFESYKYITQPQAS
jgi:group I intron endonuclease